jgi:hypothetical protein
MLYFIEEMFTDKVWMNGSVCPKFSRACLTSGSWNELAQPIPLPFTPGTFHQICAVYEVLLAIRNTFLFLFSAVFMMLGQLIAIFWLGFAL